MGRPIAHFDMSHIVGSRFVVRRQTSGGSLQHCAFSYHGADVGLRMCENTKKEECLREQLHMMPKDESQASVAMPMWGGVGQWITSYELWVERMWGISLR